MNWVDYFWVLSTFKISSTEEGKISFEPRNKHYNKRKLAKITKKYNLENMRAKEFMDFHKKALLDKDITIKANSIIAKEFKRMSPTEVSRLSNEKKIKYLDAVVPELGTVMFDEVKNVFGEHKDNLQACLFSLDFPREFLEHQDKKLDELMAELKKIPNIKNSLKNYTETSLHDRLRLANQAAKAFCKVYNLEETDVEIFTEDEYIELHKESGAGNNGRIPPAFQLGDTIKISKNHLKNSDNYFPLTTVFHEMIHILQKEKEFEEFPLVKKMMKEKFELLKHDKDLYLLAPYEKHAYLMQFKLERKIADELSIPKSRNNYSDTEKESVEKIVNTARAIAFYSRKDK